MKKLIFFVAMMLMVYGCSGSTNDSLSNEQKTKEFERSYFIYLDDTSLVLQFLDDNSTIVLADIVTSADKSMLDRIINNVDDHLLFSKDYGSLLFPVYSDYFTIADYYLIDLTEKNPMPVLLDSRIIINDNQNKPYLYANENFDQFAYITRDGFKNSTNSLYLNDLNEVTLVAEDVDKSIFLATSDLSRLLFSFSKSGLYMHDKTEGTVQLTTSRTGNILSISNDFESIIFRADDDDYYYVHNREEHRFPDDHLIQSKYLTGRAYMDSKGRILSFSVEDSEYLLKDVINVNQGNYDIQERIDNDEYLRLTYLNIFSPNEEEVKIPITSFIAQPSYSESLKSNVFVARPIDQEKLSKLKVNISELGINRWNEIYGIQRYYGSDNVLLYQLDNNLSTMILNGFDHNDSESVYGSAYWLEEGKELISLVSSDEYKELNDNQRILQIHSIEAGKSTINPLVIDRDVCDFDLPTPTWFDSDSRVEIGTFTYSKPTQDTCEWGEPQIVHINDTHTFESIDGTYAQITYLHESSEYVYSSYYIDDNKLYSSLNLVTQDRTINISDKITHYKSDGGKYILYFATNEDLDNLVAQGEIWLFDGENTQLTVNEATRLLFVFNAKK